MSANSKCNQRVPSLHLTLVFLLMLICSARSHAASISKADNSDPLNFASSWIGDVAPGPSDVAVWDANTTSANSTLLGASRTWRGISIVDPAAPVSILSGNTLTLGSAGIDMSNPATQDLTISSNLVLQPGQLQTWTIAPGHTLTLNSGFFHSLTAGLFISNAGGAILAANIANTNSMLGPWAFISSPGSAAPASSAGFTYARVSGGAIIPFTNATAATSVAWPTLNPSTNNYDLTGGAASMTANRTANTVRYVGSTLTQNLSAMLTLNGLMNSGTGQFTLGVGSSAGRLGVGTFNNSELVLNAANAPLRIDVPIANSTDNTGSIAIYGSNTVTLTAASTYTGATTVFGTLQLGAGGATGTLASTQDILNNGQLIIDHSDSLTIANAITGTGALTKTGTGTIFLAGSNSYTGPTTVSQGNLAFSAPYIPLTSLTIADGAAAAVAQNGSRLLSVSSLILVEPHPSTSPITT